MQHLDRPLAADLFIHQAMDIYKKEGDDEGLAKAYKAYGFFLNNPYIRWAVHYQPTGSSHFLDSSITLENHREKAIDYLNLSRELFERKGNYVEMTNVDFNLGVDMPI